MRKYLKELHKKPEHHKKRFALLVSGTTTLLIFTIWCVAKFGTFSGNVAADTEVKDTASSAVSPLESIRASASDAFSTLGTEFDKAKQGLESVDVNNNYGQ
jgi:hypothetical protein